MGQIIDAVANIGQTSSADRARTAARDQAAAAQGAAEERDRVQREQFGKAVTMAEGNVARTQDLLAPLLENANTPQALRALNQSIETQSAQLDRQIKLFESIDPAIMEASQQVLQLLQGEDAAALDPVKKQRASQRQALVDRLREQMGPGAETSTAGIQALNQFDQQTNQIMSQTQQQSLGQLFGIAQGGAQGRSALNQGASVLGNLGQQSIGNLFGAVGAEQTARGGLLQAQMGRAGAATDTAGARFVGDQLRAQGEGAMAQQQYAANAGLLGAAVGGAATAGFGALFE